MNLHKGIFVLTHDLYDKRFISLYRRLMNNLNREYQTLLEEQNRELNNILRYSYRSVPFYRNRFRKLGINPEEIRNRKDLELLPILSKQEVKEFYDDFTPIDLHHQKYLIRSTGGSTGIPLHYRLSKLDHLMSGCLLYRGWSHAGYRLGDRVVFLAGASLGVKKNRMIKGKVENFARNIKKLSSFDMTEENMNDYLSTINQFNPKFIRGYASSIFFFSKWLQENNLSIQSPTAVLTTAEKLSINMRNKINEVFNCPVFDGYGLNDGGISAYELADHSGMRIDTERAVLEVVDDSGNQLNEGTGRILATSLLNEAFPFIRYDTGDIGTIKVKDDGTQILTNVVGRQQEILITPDGKYIHGEFFSHIFWDVKYVNRFQVIQVDLHHIDIKIVPEEGFSNSQIKQITDFIYEKCPNWNVHIDLVDEIDTTRSGKYRFVINEIEQNSGSL